MSAQRPTFSEHWYRIAELRPRLRNAVQSHRQHYRGQDWHVLEDPGANRFFRLNDGAYRFIGLLDGRRSVADAWWIANEQIGDAAPTQGEAVQLLAQLYTSDLLRADIPDDAQVLFERQRRRRRKEAGGRAASFLFIRIPIWDPDTFLNRWVGLIGPLFSRIGLVLWGILLLAALVMLTGHWSELGDGAMGVLSPANMPLLYLAFALTKLLHELGHGFACKHFGRKEGGRGEVHVLGIMLLVLMPVPYVDASSAWALRDKWRRVVIGAAGMIVELGVAALAAMIWVSTGPGLINALAYNIIFVAGVSTLLFNANPLLRYDGYYILCDLLETPNLAQRSKEQLHHIVKRYAWRVRRSMSPAHSPGERPLLVSYGIAAAIYRVFITVAIVLFIADQLFIIGILLALGAFVMFFVVPVWKLVHFIGTSPQLERTRGLAIATSLAAAFIVVGFIGLVPLPERPRVDGIVDAEVRHEVYAQEGGRVVEVQAASSSVAQQETVLIRLENAELLALRDATAARLEGARARYRLALAQDAAMAKIEADQAAALEERLSSLDARLAALTHSAPAGGQWIVVQDLVGRVIAKGDHIGTVMSPDARTVRVLAGQHVSAGIVASGTTKDVEIRPRGRPSQRARGVAGAPLPASRQTLPSPALALGLGGTIAATQDEQGTLRPRERLFEIPVAIIDAGASDLFPGQRVTVRFALPSRPLAAQWVDATRRLFQRRFGTVL